MVTNGYKWVTNGLHTCPCGKAYNHRQGLYRHKKTCSFQETAVILSDGSNGKAEVLESSTTETDFQTKLVNTLKELLPQMASNNITNNNHITNNNRISNNQINIFLNEKCADAMSIQQFAKQLTFTIDDVLMKKQDALVKVINQNLGPLEVTERPVHCTNVARRRWHVKDETEGWHKDDGSTLVRRVNNSLLRKSPVQYAETFPGWSTQPKRQDEYVQIVGMTSSEMEPKAEARILTSVAQRCDLEKVLLSTDVE